MYGFSKIFILVGIVFIVIGVIFFFSEHLEFFKFFGNLPGDIKIEKENFRFYFPITTSLLISIILSLILFLLRFLNK